MRSLHSESTPSSGPVEKEGERTDMNSRNTSTKTRKIFTCASDQIPVRLDMDFSARVPVAESAPRHGWNGVALVVYPLELGDLGVEKRCPGRVTDSRGSERSTLDPRPRREIELQI